MCASRRFTQAPELDGFGPPSSCTLDNTHNTRSSPYPCFYLASMMGSAVPEAKRAEIYAYILAGWPRKKIAKKFKVDLSTVSRIYRRRHYGKKTYKESPRTGRPQKLAPSDLKFAQEMFYSGKASNATDLQQKFFPDVSVRMLQQQLTDFGLHGRVRQKVPYITANGVDYRFGWAQGLLDWTAEDWRKVAFSDECRYKLFGSDGRCWCRRFDGDAYMPQFTKKRVAHGGGSLMVSGWLTSRGVGTLLRVEGNVNAANYVSLLRRGLLSTIQKYKLPKRNTLFQQDNAPAHTSELAWQFYQENNLYLLHWPSYSPNLNIIENLWDYLDRQIRKRDPLPTNLDELWVAIQEEWNAIPQSYIDTLYDSMPRRVSQVYAAEGWNIGY
jgi:hypothetical protein